MTAPETPAARKRIGFLGPASVVLFIALTLAGTFYVRKLVLERALLSAMKTGDVGTARDLIRSWPSPVGARTRFGETVLHWAVSLNDNALLAEALDRGADPNAFAACASAQDPDSGELAIWPDEVNGEWARQWRKLGDKTPLHCAVFLARWGTARALVARGADVNLPTRNPDVASGGESVAPVQMAAFYGPQEFVRFLVESGANVRVGGKVMLCPLSAVVRGADNHCVGMVAYLLDHGADIEHAGRDGWHPLHYAAASWNGSDAVRALLDRGAKIDARDSSGETPLHTAVWFGARLCAEALVERGADLSAKNKDGQTPLMLTDEKLHVNSGEGNEVKVERARIAELLRARGATQ